MIERQFPIANRFARHLESLSDCLQRERSNHTRYLPSTHGARGTASADDAVGVAASGCNVETGIGRNANEDLNRDDFRCNPVSHRLIRPAVLIISRSNTFEKHRIDKRPLQEDGPALRASGSPRSSRHAPCQHLLIGSQARDGHIVLFSPWR